MIGRFAPTPSGRLHLGNLLCAMLAYLSARSQGGQFLLRIEDVDIPRCPRALAQQAIDDLRFLGFRWDAPPLYQSERSGVYQDVLNRLRREGHVYPCFCTRAQLHTTVAPNLGDTQFIYPGTCAHLTPEEAAERAQTRAPAMRLRVPDETITFTDRVFGTQAENLARDCGDFLLQRSDGLFGYQLAVVVDDALSGVTEVVRGRDILSATPRQIYFTASLGLSAACLRAYSPADGRAGAAAGEARPRFGSVRALEALFAGGDSRLPRVERGDPARNAPDDAGCADSAVLVGQNSPHGFAPARRNLP